MEINQVKLSLHCSPSSKNNQHSFKKLRLRLAEGVEASRPFLSTSAQNAITTAKTNGLRIHLAEGFSAVSPPLSSSAQNSIHAARNNVTSVVKKARSSRDEYLKMVWQHQLATNGSKKNGRLPKSAKIAGNRALEDAQEVNQRLNQLREVQASVQNHRNYSDAQRQRTQALRDRVAVRINQAETLRGNVDRAKNHRDKYDRAMRASYRDLSRANKILTNSIPKGRQKPNARALSHATQNVLQAELVHNQNKMEKARAAKYLKQNRHHDRMQRAIDHRRTMQQAVRDHNNTINRKPLEGVGVANLSLENRIRVRDPQYYSDRHRNKNLPSNQRNRGPQYAEVQRERQRAEVQRERQRAEVQRVVREKITARRQQPSSTTQRFRNLPPTPAEIKAAKS